MSKEGHVVNIDHNGNRVVAMIYEPDKAVIAVNKNKICNSLDDAVQRIRSILAPLNAKRAGYYPLCLKLNIDCKTDERVCYNLVIIEGQFVKSRMKLFIINEELEF